MEYIPIIISLILIILVYQVLARPVLSGAPFLPIDKKSLNSMIKLAQTGKNTIASDLGSGDGRIVIELAKKGIESHGYEVNPLLVIISRFRIRKLRLEDKAFIYWKSFWKVNLSKYNVITLYGITKIMPRLETKLQKELKENSRIISYVFKFPNWKILETNDNNHLYIKK